MSMGWYGMVWDGMGWYGMGWDVCVCAAQRGFVSVFILNGFHKT